jgi:hypothetical protein
MECVSSGIERPSEDGLKIITASFEKSGLQVKIGG